MLYVSNEVILDAGLSDDAVLAYFFLQVLTYSPNYESVTFSVSQIIDQAYGIVNSHSVQGKIKAGLKEIVDNGYLDIVQESPNWWRIYMSSYQVQDQGYTVVDADAVRMIMDDEKLRNRASLIRYYLLVLASIYSKTRVGIYDQRWFCNILNVVPQTISKYTAILEEKELIYVYRAAEQNISNTYGRFEDKELVRIEGEKRAKGREAHENANSKRRYVGMYRKFLDGKEYDKDTLVEILKGMKERNNELLNLGANARGEVYDLQPLIDKINA